MHAFQHAATQQAYKQLTHTRNSRTHADECALQQCAQTSLECIWSNWREPSRGHPSHCASLKWRPRYYLVPPPDIPTNESLDFANETYDDEGLGLGNESSEEDLYPNHEAPSPANSTGGNGSNSTVLVLRGGFLVHDPPCSKDAQWLVHDAST
jgi:hypothetical protein